MPMQHPRLSIEMIVYRLGVGLLMLAGASVCGAAEIDQLTPPAAPVPPFYFGIHNHRFHDQAMRPMIDFGTWRLWGAGVEWTLLQPKENEWNFRRLDFALSVANSSDYDVLLTFGRTPRWASAQPDRRSFYGPGEAAPPRNMNDFARFVRRVASRYKGRIKSYEVWNEPASSGFFSGTVEQMVEMTRIVDQEVARADPTARIVCPSPAKYESLNWFGRFVAAGGANYCDIIGYHFYTDSEFPEERLNLIRKVFDVLKAHDLTTKPVWDTESGLSIGNKNADSPAASARGHIARWLILTWASGVERFYWYAWDHDRLGFVNPSGDMREPELAAYQIVQKWMLGSSFQECARVDQRWNCHLTLKNGKSAILFWTQDNSKQAVDVTPPVWLEDLHGFAGSIQGGLVSITGDPVLVVQ
ncbi:MAG: hypothetical protein H5U26_11745 [Immundisolibacter sp.]|uniref:glycosyl hydrolase n=1 Tax=Immundisolibacter sp. TaxID=1934948 RepID=UPI0019B7B525|nr:glycosyl hydrolase [Immundisolibacter sp.]MBC7162763.1 hypothetical protein [Immundisolibacter sp.]